MLSLSKACCQVMGNVFLTMMLKMKVVAELLSGRERFMSTEGKKHGEE